MFFTSSVAPACGKGLEKPSTWMTRLIEEKDTRPAAGRGGFEVPPGWLPWDMTNGTQRRCASSSPRRGTFKPPASPLSLSPARAGPYLLRHRQENQKNQKNRRRSVDYFDSLDLPDGSRV